jgi:hypothetical protein
MLAPPEGADISDLQPVATKAATRTHVNGFAKTDTVIGSCLCFIMILSLFPRGIASE